MTKVRHVQMSAFPDLAPDKPVGPILPSVFQGTNADLMAAVAPYYLTGSVCDVTYGNGDTAGGWWRKYTPAPFTYHDLALDGVDFRALPEPDGSVDTVCYDPPYVAQGGTKDETIGERFRDRYGMTGVEVRYGQEDEHRTLIMDGLTDVCRVARCWVLVKCMEFVSSRQFHDMPYEITDHVRDLGWVKYDVIVHHTGSGPGGHNIYDPKRARRHHSYLLVFTKP